MAADLERLVVQLSADIKKYENALGRAQGITNRRLGDIQRKASTSSAAIGASFARAGVQIAAAFLASEAVRNIEDLSEAATRIDNALKVAGLSGEKLEGVYAKLSKAAKDNGAPVEALVGLYSKASLVQKELGVSSEELIGFSANVALALRVAGTDAQAASGALMQLGQALGSGVVHAEEFNSILEGAPTIAQAAAAGLKEAGGSVSALKNLVIDGKISSEAFFRAFEAGSVILEQRAANATFTLSQASTNLWTALVDVAREFNNSTGAGERFAGAINSAANAVSRFDVSGFISKLQGAKGALDSFLSDLGNADIFKRLSEAMGVTDGSGLVINIDKKEAEQKTVALEREVQLLQQTISKNTSLGFDNSEALARLGEVQAALASVKAAAANLPATMPNPTIETIAAAGGVDSVSSEPSPTSGPSTRGSRKPKTVSPVSLVNFTVPDKAGGGGSAKKGSKGSGGQSDYQREIEQIKERTSALQAEFGAQSQVNPLVEDYGYTMEKARVQHELLTAAQQSGLTVTPQLRASIDQLAEGYAQASVQVEKLQASQDKARQASEDFKNTSKDVVSGFISDLRSGTSAAEALSNALDKVIDKLIDASLNSIFGIGGGGGGLFSLFPFAKGGIAAHGKPLKTFDRGGVSRSAAIFGEAGPEAAVPLPDGRSIPVKFQTPAIPKRSSAAPQNVHVTVGVSTDGNGNLMPFVESVSQGQVQKAAPRIVSAASKNVVPTMAAYQSNKAGAEWRS